jgi:antitoxin component of RelBE/YafQ-DinJ toxin-antitoxin module
MKKENLNQVVRVRVSENTRLRIKAYAQKNNCSDSDVIRMALTPFLRYVSTKKLQNV